jgi:hypothetical protein
MSSFQNKNSENEKLDKDSLRDNGAVAGDI